jgi:flavin-binding protein dodecin
MANHVYKQIRLTGTSDSSIEEAVNLALEKAAKTVHNMRWFEIIETRGQIDDGQVSQWQVSIRVGFTLED